MIFPLEDDEVVGEVRGVAGLFVLNPLWYGILTGSGGGEGLSSLIAVVVLP